MITPKTSLSPTPTGSAGWVGRLDRIDRGNRVNRINRINRIMAGLGVMTVIAVGLAISPAATNAAHEWSRATGLSEPPPATMAEGPRRSRPETRPVSRPVPSIDRSEPLRVEPVAVQRPADRPALARRVISRLMARARSGLERLAGGVVVTSAAR